MHANVDLDGGGGKGGYVRDVCLLLLIMCIYVISVLEADWPGCKIRQAGETAAEAKLGNGETRQKGVLLLCMHLPVRASGFLPQSSDELSLLTHKCRSGGADVRKKAMIIIWLASPGLYLNALMMPFLSRAMSRL